MVNNSVESCNKSPEYYENPREEMLKYIPKDVEISLEFGCGCGNFSESIKNAHNAECWGVEIEAQSAKKAAEKLYRVINADAHQSLVEIPDNYFDCIVFNDVLEHLVDPYSLLQNVKGKLNERGVVVASIPNVRFWNNLRTLAIHGEWDYKEAGILDRTHLRFFTYKSIIKMFNELNYNIITIEGLNPTQNRKFKIVNALSFNKLEDVRYHQFACVVRPKRL
ncbi:MAG: class I SAM-dependent methyltransferase [Sedimentisphaerales bacterium]